MGDWRTGRHIEGGGESLRGLRMVCENFRRRSSCPAFHPEGNQAILDLGSDIFALERKSVDESLTVVCLLTFSLAQ